MSLDFTRHEVLPALGVVRRPFRVDRVTGVCCCLRSAPALLWGASDSSRDEVFGRHRLTGVRYGHRLAGSKDTEERGHLVAPTREVLHKVVELWQEADS